MKSRYIDNAEVNILFEQLRGTQLLAAQVLVLTGVRVGDLVKIAVDDLSFSPPGFYYVAQKTGKRGFAELPTPFVFELLKNARGGWCFPSRKRGKHLTRQAVWKTIKGACTKAGLDPAGISPHSCRKHFAVEVCKSGGLVKAKELLQHADASTTEIYALSDYLTGENAEKPILRKDLPQVLNEIASILRIELDNK